MPFSGGRKFPPRIFVNPATGTWDLVFEPHPGILCLHAVGTDFRPAPPRKGTPS